MTTSLPRNSELTLRAASLDDVDLLMHWDTQPQVIEAVQHGTWNWLEDLSWQPDWREQLIAEYKGRPIGFVQIIDPALEETHYWGEVESNLRAIDIWIGEPDYLGRGFGTGVMALAIARCFEDPEVKGILVDPLSGRLAVHRFFERLGFRFFQNRSFPNEEPCTVYFLSRDEHNRRNSTGK